MYAMVLEDVVVVDGASVAVDESGGVCRSDDMLCSGVVPAELFGERSLIVR